MDDVRSYTVRRTQIYIDDEQDRRLAARAAASSRTKSDLIREALDRYLATESAADELAEFRAAVRAVAGIAPYLPDGVEYVRQIRAGELARAEALERRWRQE